MKKIELNSSFLARLTNAEHDYLHRSCCETFTEKGADIGLIAPARKRHAGSYKLVDVAFKIGQKREETGSLEYYDRLRDTEWSDLKLLTDISKRSKNPVVKAAAEKVGFVLNRYKDAANKAYAENTDLIINLLQDLSVEPYVAAIETLQATELLASLEENNKAFDRIYKERSIHNYEIDDLGKLIQLRAQADRDLLELIDQVNSVYKTYVLSGSDQALVQKLEVIIKEVSAYIKQAERVYYTRVGRTRPEKKPDPSDPGDPEDGPYFFEIDSETIVDNSILLTDKNPDLFHEHFDRAALEGSELSRDLPEGLESAGYVFEDFIFNGDSLPIGFKILSTIGVPLDFSGGPLDYMVMAKDGKIILRFDAFQEAVHGG